MSLNNLIKICKTTQTQNGWDTIASTVSKNIGIKMGLATIYSIETIDNVIPKERRNENLTILDVACGFGPLPVYISSNSNQLNEFKNTKIIATDFSEKMIQVLNALIEREQLNNITTHVMDGQNLELIKDNSIDYTFSLFGLVFFPSIEKGLNEMYRVLKSNNLSKVGITAMCSDSFFNKVYQETMNELLTLQNNNTPTLFNQTALSLSDKDYFENLLKSIGFKDIEIKKVKHVIEFNEYEDAIKMFPNNPVYQEGIDQLTTIEIKDKFNETFIKHMKLLNPKRSIENNKLQLDSFSFIGIATK